ncbi:GGDEF domain-containing protein [Aquabacterium soli]|uniref:diguanylate cyclase n=1 Tax=Aquabacterium soli TaxID=2493092 RepID=A0A3R8YNZ0_9BURK|nr:diguanylate cyclase [Aquabacterium soli]RRS04722.1 GGDEF domain-containing protein [Aquabacterium soli]
MSDNNDKLIRQRRSLSLAAGFWLISAALFLMAVLGLGRLTFIDWRDLRRAEHAVVLIEQLRLGMISAEMASRERGPANGVLGADAPTPRALGHSLNEARLRTDQAYAAFAQALGQVSGDDRHQSIGRQVDGFQAALHQARLRVDALSAQPLARREPEAIKAAVDGMVRLVRMLRPSIMLVMEDLQQDQPLLSSTVSSALLAAELRELTGQLGSLLTPALSRQTALSDDERLAIERMRGRIGQLRVLLTARVHVANGASAVRHAQERLERDYFGRAEALVRQVVQAGQTDGRYGLSTAEFAARYVPDMNAIIDMRDALLAEALQQGAALHLAQRRAMAVMLGMTGLHIALIVLGLYLMHRRVIRPLSRAAEALQAMKEDRYVALVAPVQGDEISAVFDGIADLQAQSRDRRALEAERDKLIERLRVQSSTDFLTSLPNRRAFFEAAEAEVARARRHGFGLVVLLLDVDHFKRINDALGHAVGDLALVALTEVLRQSVRQGDIAARIGGEEFVLLLSHCEREDGLRFAERLRQTVASTVVEVGSEHPPVRMTVSIGLADTQTHGMNLDLLMSRADHAMYGAKRAGRDRIEVAGPA